MAAVDSQSLWLNRLGLLWVCVSQLARNKLECFIAAAPFGSPQATKSPTVVLFEVDVSGFE